MIEVIAIKEYGHPVMLIEMCTLDKYVLCQYIHAL